MQGKCRTYRGRRRRLCDLAGATRGHPGGAPPRGPPATEAAAPAPAEKAVPPPRRRGWAGPGWAGLTGAWLGGRHRQGAGMGPGGWWRAARALRAAGGGWSRAAAPGPTCRRLCAAAAPNLSYQELKDLKKANVLHIDVRERWEIDRFGKIPESINIPLGELMEALQMDPTEFKEQYNQKMPSKSDPVVFSCLAGTRSKQALAFAISLGFSRDNIKDSS
ncbi:thiosulfate:glutathione sulfurtransferase isoform 2-T2 [Geothlypis trichas]